MKNLQRGKSYTRDDIHTLLGGGKQEYLPHVDGRVVCACLKKSMNPGIPDKILVGDGVNVIRWARVFGEQRHFVPVFLKRESNEWVYVGNYRVLSLSEDRDEIRREADRAGRTGVTMILRLERELA